MSNKPPVHSNVLSLNINSRTALYSVYMPFLKHGGIFIPTSREYQMGDEVFILLSLMDDPSRLPISGKVVWITASGGQKSKPQGVGVHFNSDEGCIEARRRMEGMLAGVMKSSRPTHTL